MTQAMDKLRECKELARLLEERYSCWQKQYQEYQAMLAEFRIRQQNFDFLMETWKQEHRGNSPVDLTNMELEISGDYLSGSHQARSGKIP